MFRIETLPRYVVATVDKLKDEDSADLAIRKKARTVDFPLNIEDKAQIAIIMSKFTKQPFYSGLAGPQLGIMKRIIVFTMPRNECTDSCRTKVWLNPSYEKVGDKMSEDYECCVSVKGVTGPVKRYETIHYKANNVNGKVIEGEARGRTARLIQHETDHLNGKLFIDFVAQNKLISVREFAQKVKFEHLAQLNEDEKIFPSEFKNELEY